MEGFEDNVHPFRKPEHGRQRETLSQRKEVPANDNQSPEEEQLTRYHEILKTFIKDFIKDNRNIDELVAAIHDVTEGPRPLVPANSIRAHIYEQLLHLHQELENETPNEQAITRIRQTIDGLLPRNKPAEGQ
jgi:hypothetical protein